MLPEKSDSYYYAQDVFYKSYNQILFFVEDEAKEELYFTILKKIFPSIDFHKIFPLCGKTNVLEHYFENVRQTNYIYILDKDFDDIFGFIIEKENIIYLERYSIENYLLEPESLQNFIISKKPTVNRLIINEKINLSEIINSTVMEVAKLVPSFVLIQKHLIDRISSLKRSPESYFSNISLSIDELKYKLFMEEIERAFVNQSISIDINKELISICDNLNISIYCNALKHAPGKYICYIILKNLKKLFRFVNNTTEDQFIYHLATTCTFESLEFIKTKVNCYLSANFPK